MFSALRDLHGQYLLNGNWKIDISQPRDIAGTTFEYDREAHPSLGPETLSAPGPTNQPIFIVVSRFETFGHSPTTVLY